jgi:hypothetical protein
MYVPILKSIKIHSLHMRYICKYIYTHAPRAYTHVCMYILIYLHVNSLKKLSKKFGPTNINTIYGFKFD